MKIYTKTGDGGTTALYRGGRVPKDSPRIRACGDVDELNAHLGALRSQGLPADADALVQSIQNDLFVIGADIAAPPESVKKGDDVVRLPGGSEQPLETAIDRMEAQLMPLRQFILPGGSPAASAAHVARSVCRRAERSVVALASEETIAPQIMVYLNRLSDYLFVLARSLNQISGSPDVHWQSNKVIK